MRVFAAVLFLGLPALPAQARSRATYRELAEGLGNAPAAERPLMALALGRSRRKNASVELVRRLDTEADPALAAAVAEALGRTGRKGAVLALLDAWERLLERKFKAAGLPEGWETVRAEIAGALGRLGDARALPALRRGLIDGDPSVAARSIEAVGLLEDGESAKFLVPHLDSKDPGVRDASFEALGRIGGKDAFKALDTRRGSADRTVRVLAACGLDRMKRKAGRVLLDGFIEEEPEPYADGILAARCLTSMDEGGGLRYLDRIARDPASGLRAEAVRALGASGNKRAVLPLAPLLKEEDASLRLETVRALGELGGSRALYELRKSLKDPDEEVRRAVREALARLGWYVEP